MSGFKNDVNIIVQLEIMSRMMHIHFKWSATFGLGKKAAAAAAAAVLWNNLDVTVQIFTGVIFSVLWFS